MSHSGIRQFNYFLVFFFVLITEGLNEIEASASLKNIAGDYFWGNTILRARPRKLTCDDKRLQEICKKKCGEVYECIHGKCLCEEKNAFKYFIKKTMNSFKHFLKTLFKNQSRNSKVEEKQSRSSREYDSLRTAVQLQEVQLQDDDDSEHPALRHHIAHFCPNLDEARKCVTRCMKIGKPAFCGKDHVCYCGHRYNSHDENKPTNLNDRYAEFRDLYEKYFGPQSGESMNHDEVQGDRGGY